MKIHKFVIAILFCALTFPTAAQNQNQNQNQQDEKVTVPKSMLTQDQISQLNQNNIKNNVSSWAGVGKEVGEAVNSSLSAITTQTNNFAQTGVGKVTVAIVVWKVLGDQIVHLVFGLIEMVVFLPLWIWSYRRTCLDRRIKVKGGFFSNDKEWEVVKYKDNYGMDDFTPRIGHWITIAVIVLVIILTVFSF